MNTIRLVKKGAKVYRYYPTHYSYDLYYSQQDTIEVPTEWTQEEAVELLKINYQDWDMLHIRYDLRNKDAAIYPFLVYLRTYLQQQIERKWK
jgi:hypothetical protein